MAHKPVRPESISIDEFNALLDQYPALVGSISESKGSKPGQKTLAELDEFRYNEAVDLFGSKSPKQPMNHDHVKLLVDWKLRHGTFRPTLMKLVSSNDGETVQDTIQTAMGKYWAKPDPAAVLAGIGKLRGIGPATASLILSVHDPARAIFFSDEAFYWLCCGGHRRAAPPIKYSAKEYRELNAAAQALVARLGVGATDVEKVAYVVLKQGGDAAAAGPGREKKKKEKEAGPVPAPGKKESAKEEPKKKAKRKEQPVVEEQPSTGLRRSKRSRPSK